MEYFILGESENHTFIRNKDNIQGRNDFISHRGGNEGERGGRMRNGRRMVLFFRKRRLGRLGRLGKGVGSKSNEFLNVKVNLNEASDVGMIERLLHE